MSKSTLLVVCAMLTLAGATLSFAASGSAASAQPASTSCPAYLNQDFKKLRSSETLNICKSFAGKPMLIVNTASHCGFTPQFKGLQGLYEKYQSQGLAVIGFPSDSFNQEDADEAKTAEVCYLNYGVKFPMVAVSDVKGAKVNSVFAELNKQAGEPNWNFNKYLVAADGKVIKHYGSMTAPDSKDLLADIDAALAAAK